jgi:hypothetical protein
MVGSVCTYPFQFGTLIFKKGNQYNYCFLKKEYQGTIWGDTGSVYIVFNTDDPEKIQKNCSIAESLFKGHLIPIDEHRNLLIDNILG